MPDALFGGFDISSSAMSAERLRMTVAAENLANADSTRRLANGLPYARQRVVFSSELDQAGQLTGKVLSEVVASPRYDNRHDPTHPDADANGVVTSSAIDPILEMVDLMTASKSYDANANASRGLLRMHESALRLGEIQG
ncbi:MAG TPA: flagellar basal body rod protein FlgC [Planctomycetes bacterium]|nr:flagellar basal body rod protein FlgC [Planctomycetota bacterium]